MYNHVFITEQRLSREKPNGST